MFFYSTPSSPTLLNASILINVFLLLALAVVYGRRIKRNRSVLSNQSMDSYSSIARRFPELSPRELLLVELILERATTERIADQLHISPDSVKKSKYRLKRKLKVAKSESLDAFLFRTVHQFPLN